MISIHFFPFIVYFCISILFCSSQIWFLFFSLKFCDILSTIFLFLYNAPLIMLPCRWRFRGSEGYPRPRWGPFRWGSPRTPSQPHPGISLTVKSLALYHTRLTNSAFALLLFMVNISLIINNSLLLFLLFFLSFKLFFLFPACVYFSFFFIFFFF